VAQQVLEAWATPRHEPPPGSKKESFAMFRLARAAALTTALTLTAALPACTASSDDMAEAEGAIVDLPPLDVGPTVRAFQFDAVANRELKSFLRIEEENENAAAVHAAAVSAARARVDRAKDDLKSKKRELKPSAPRKRCWIFFRCVDWDKVPEVVAAKSEVRAAKDALRNVPSLILQEQEPLKNIIDRIAKIHDPNGYAKVAPMDKNFGVLEVPTSDHAARLRQAKERVTFARDAVANHKKALEQLRDNGQGRDPETTDVEALLEPMTVAVEKTLLASRDEMFQAQSSFAVLRSAMSRDEHYRNERVRDLPRPIDADLVDFPSELDDLDFQINHASRALSALNDLLRNLDGHASAVSALQRDISQSRQESLRWQRDYLSKTEADIRRLP